MPDSSERTLAARVRRPDVVLAAIALLFCAGVVGALVSSVAPLPAVAVGCVGAICVIGAAVFVVPPVGDADG